MINIGSLLNINNYFDSIIITDNRGIIEYYSNMRSDIYDLRQDEIIGKSILEIHPYLTQETSSIMRVLKDGRPIYDQIEYLTTKHGQNITNIYSTLPIVKEGKVVGAIDLARCVNENERQSIILTRSNNEKERLYQLNDIITKSPAMNEIKSKIMRIANTDSSVMIYGETGTGKELIAQSIHSYSYRNSNKFISQNCAAIPSNLLEGILFGTVKGSYTGAENRRGLFEVANGGTLFLDEINSMDINMQSKILKAIEEKKVTRIGGTEPIDTDIRIITALNEQPLSCVEQNTLREDLYYRLNVVQIDIPPLRERSEDITYLTDYFISRYNSKMNKSIIGLSDEVKELFLNYSWPGNIRELRNVIEGAFNIIGSRYIQLRDLPHYLVSQFKNQLLNVELNNQEMSLVEKVESYEKRLLINALVSSETIAEAARKLKLSKQALSYKLSKYNLK
ncbi:sigma 54-interacting transcriptional regulator [Tissierella carlieri]|uniref:sigma-54 interaction domain-containing protein n=1 Tax=Tissierella carlieri TaxID=689904 RepID=UPI001C0F4138|nr:sigma 54-interacting transcriptional regulator [uncultured Tissierella sp.]MBU5313374.1 sigma 54-interacting transcriptional regulator [Tissierella carlieri]MDU5082659.1 sigma 54-interacting transcriptional regulator [Bacillota bacterium]